MSDLACSFAVSLDEANCLAALVDAACTGIVHSVHVRVEGFDESTIVDSSDDDEYATGFDSVQPYNAELTHACPVPLRTLRRIIEEREFPPCALLSKCMPAQFDDKWLAHIRVRNVNVRAMSKAWNIPQTRIRLVLRQLQVVGIAEENQCGDYFYLSVHRFALRLVHIGARLPGLREAFFHQL